MSSDEAARRATLNAAHLVAGEDDFRRLEGARLTALVTRDFELARALHAPDFQLVTPKGDTYGRDAYLQAVAAGELSYLRWQPLEIAVRAFPTVALLRYRADLEMGADLAHSHRFSCWHTDSYELRGEQWQLVWSHATLIR